MILNHRTHQNTEKEIRSKELVEDVTLTLANYKEPLTKIKKGFGYYGTLSITTNGKLIQCHICGELFQSLPFHVLNAHKIKSRDYKEKFGLSPTTALVSEEYRAELKQRTLDWIKSLSPEEKEEYCLRKKQVAKDNIKNHKMGGESGWKVALETKNKRGACPNQLLAKISEVAKKIGHTPSQAEFVQECGTQRFKHLIYTTFGSWKNALEMGKFKPKNFIHSGRKEEYEDEELLEYLRIFTETHSKVPTSTDLRRGLLPSEGCYKRFGGLVKARELAGIELPEKKLGYKGGFGKMADVALLDPSLSLHR